jgi:predicted NAD/FAD-binding protein
MKIAVVGAGIAGLTSAYTLSRAHEVTVFEAGHYAGGHANTVDVTDGGRQMPIDTGFIVFNEPNYPHLCRLFDALDVASHESEMSFAVRCERTGREWNGSSLNQVFAQRRNLLRPSHWKMLADIVRFHREAPDVMKMLDDSVSVSQWIERQHYSRAFADYYLLPLGASLWSCSAKHFSNFPMCFVLEFLNNHHMLQVEGRPVWRTVTGGSREYVKRIVLPFAERLHLNAPVSKVERVAAGVDVTVADGTPQHYDEVIFACHADQALSVLADPDDEERDVLGCFPYQKNIAVLHKDTSVLPTRRRAWASWNFAIPSDVSEEVNVTYNMNLLQKLDAENTWSVSLNPGQRIAPDLEAARFVYDHPMFTAGRAEAQARHASLVRRRGISYCGAYWGFGFHEDGARSAVAVCDAFDVVLERAA